MFMEYLHSVAIPGQQEIPEPSNTQISWSALVACDDYTAVKRRSSNAWTSNQRVTLAWLASFENPMRDLAKVFNASFREELPTDQGLSEAAVSSYWYCLRLTPDEEEALAALKGQTSSSTASNLPSITRRLFRKIANDLGIQLVDRPAGSGPRPSRATNVSKISKKKRKVADTDVSSSDEDSLVMLETPSTHPQTPKRSRFEEPSKYYASPPPSSQKPVKQVNLTTLRAPQTLKPRKNNDAITSQRLARLAYRSWSPLSYTSYNAMAGFRAGMFPDASKTIPQVPEPDTFREYALKHVEISLTASPLISCTTNPMRAIKIGADLSLRFGDEAMMAVIDMHQVGGTVKATSLKLKPGCKYAASGEYLTWGTIPSTAILSIHSIPSLLARIRRIKSLDDDPFCLDILLKERYLTTARQAIANKTEGVLMSFSLGNAVGELIHTLGINSLFLSDAVWSITHAWRWRGNYRTNQVFLDGCANGFHGKPQPGVTFENDDSSEEDTDEEDSRQVYNSPHSNSGLSDSFFEEIYETAKQTAPEPSEILTALPFQRPEDVPEIKLEDFRYNPNRHVFNGCTPKLKRSDEDTMISQDGVNDSYAWTGI
ncbi:hypothetical protein ACLMJK_005955 [Lecanora helva]